VLPYPLDLHSYFWNTTLAAIGESLRKEAARAI